MKYFRAEEDENARLPKNFVSGFLEVQCGSIDGGIYTNGPIGTKLMHPPTLF